MKRLVKIKKEATSIQSRNVFFIFYEKLKIIQLHCLDEKNQNQI